MCDTLPHTEWWWSRPLCGSVCGAVQCLRIVDTSLGTHWGVSSFVFTFPPHQKHSEQSDNNGLWLGITVIWSSDWLIDTNWVKWAKHHCSYKKVLSDHFNFEIILLKKVNPPFSSLSQVNLSKSAYCWTLLIHLL